MGKKRNYGGSEDSPDACFGGLGGQIRGRVSQAAGRNCDSPISNELLAPLCLSMRSEMRRESRAERHEYFAAPGYATTLAPPARHDLMTCDADRSNILVAAYYMFVRHRNSRRWRYFRGRSSSKARRRKVERPRRRVRRRGGGSLGRWARAGRARMPEPSNAGRRCRSRCSCAQP